MQASGNRCTDEDAANKRANPDRIDGQDIPCKTPEQAYKSEGHVSVRKPCDTAVLLGSDEMCERHVFF